MKRYDTIMILGLLLGSYSSQAQQEPDSPFAWLFNVIDERLWNQDTVGISGSTVAIDRFGEAVADGDFNNDGWQDLAIGIPNHDFFFGAILNTGTVLVIYGTPNGLDPDNHQYLYQTFDNSGSNLETLNGIEANDQFGQSIASGDFNCDGFDDLAVGTPNESVILSGSTRSNVGAINIFYASASGFADNGQGSTFIWQGSGLGTSFNGSISAGDRFGWAMVTGNFDGDTHNGNRCVDLAVSTPFEDFGNADQIQNAGQVDVFYGDPAGLDGANRDSLSQNTFGIDDSAESNDQFGRSLAASRFRSDVVFSDLAVGVPGEMVDGEANAGIVQVFYGAASGLQANADDEIWHQGDGIIGVPENNDRFGQTLTTGNFNGDQAFDLAVGVTGEDLNGDGVFAAGAVNIIYGGVAGLSTTGNQIFHQNTDGINGVAENSDQFGDALTAGDLNYDLYTDLVVGVPREDGLAGAFHIIYGGNSGLTIEDNIYQNSGSLSGDEMAYVMTVGDFGAGPELVVGLPGDDSIDGENDSGSVRVYSFENPDVIFADDFDG
ncbi:integrin alpha [Marinicella meishanensis]|uniref:integrin alpha n=1 Tax=Marinicella meishanensis TaxID=2873263 RepID=UPI001CC16943|nr:integrin alpha [Marinicella sp. NBU2979]